MEDDKETITIIGLQKSKEISDINSSLKSEKRLKIQKLNSKKETPYQI